MASWDINFDFESAESADSNYDPKLRSQSNSICLVYIYVIKFKHFRLGHSAGNPVINLAAAAAVQVQLQLRLWLWLEVHKNFIWNYKRFSFIVRCLLCKDVGGGGGGGDDGGGGGGGGHWHAVINVSYAMVFHPRQQQQQQQNSYKCKFNCSRSGIHIHIHIYIHVHVHIPSPKSKSTSSSALKWMLSAWHAI